MPENTTCPTGVDLHARTVALERDRISIWDAIEKYRDRPPVWCAWAMTGLGAVAGALAGILGTLAAT